MKKFALIFVIGLALCFVVFVIAQEEEKAADPAQEVAKSIENGKELFADASLGTNEMSCLSCHLEYGTKEGKMGDMAVPAWDNIAATYPRYFATAKRIFTLDQVVNLCVTMAMKGEALAWDSQKLTDLVAFCASVKK